METKVIDLNINIEGIKEAAEVIKSGGIVVFPTETVYGLGANALDPSAVKKIFEAKGRPQDNPLIVHISDLSELEALAVRTDVGDALASAFWPGPMTLVLKKRPSVSDQVTAGLSTVAVRLPSNRYARMLISASGVPIAAPSANLSGSPSPTTAARVLSDLNGKVPIILDGGSSDIGLESTVIDATGETATILRPGGVTAEMLEGLLGKVCFAAGCKGSI